MQDPLGVVHMEQEVGESSASFVMGNIYLWNLLSMFGVLANVAGTGGRCSCHI